MVASLTFSKPGVALLGGDSVYYTLSTHRRVEPVRLPCFKHTNVQHLTGFHFRHDKVAYTAQYAWS